MNSYSVYMTWVAGNRTQGAWWHGAAANLQEAIGKALTVSHKGYGLAVSMAWLDWPQLPVRQ